jgi:hypothetical protein
VCWSPKQYLAIKLDPEFGIETEEGTRIFALWNVKSPDLTQLVAGVGIYLMQQYLPLDKFINCRCTILDLRKNKLFISDKLPARVASMVASEFAWVDQFFETAKKAA